MKTKKTSLDSQPKVRSFIAMDSKLNRAAGVHADQRRKADPKQIRRDKSYKNHD